LKEYNLSLSGASDAGKWGMGEVYLAEDGRIRRQVAIKVVRSQPAFYLDSQDARQAAQLFEREMKVISSSTPHILPSMTMARQR